MAIPWAILEYIMWALEKNVFSVNVTFYEYQLDPAMSSVFPIFYSKNC